MALVKYGGGVVAMSGSIAGNTFAKNRSGNYVRARTKPVNPQSSFQTDVRSQLAALVTRWTETLTAAQRAAWDAYAANVSKTNPLGETIFITGQNWYCAVNVPNGQAGYSYVDAAPTIFDRGTFTPVSIVPSGGATPELDVTFDNTDAWANEDDAAMLIYSSREVNPSRTFTPGSYRLAGTIEGDSVTAPTSPATLTSPFPMTNGNRVFMRALVIRADGRLSTAQNLDALIV